MWQIHNTEENFVAYKSNDDSKTDFNMNLIFGFDKFLKICCFDGRDIVVLNGWSMC
jgi:hypothetical protein